MSITPRVLRRNHVTRCDVVNAARGYIERCEPTLSEQPICDEWLDCLMKVITFINNRDFEMALAKAAKMFALTQMVTANSKLAKLLNTYSALSMTAVVGSAEKANAF